VSYLSRLCAVGNLVHSHTGVTNAACFWLSASLHCTLTWAQLRRKTERLGSVSEVVVVGLGALPRDSSTPDYSGDNPSILQLLRSGKLLGISRHSVEIAVVDSRPYSDLNNSLFSLQVDHLSFPSKSNLLLARNLPYPIELGIY
jgi:hypothetical protein